MRKNLITGIGFLSIVVFIGCSSPKSENKDQTDVSKSKNGIEYAETMNAFNEIIKGDQPVFVDFYADWCAPCRMMAPILEQVAGDMQGKVKILKVNVDKNRDAAMKYGIQSIPALMLFQKGEVKWKGVGVIQADQIKQIVLSKTN
jgi:thioredoxin 1